MIGIGSVRNGDQRTAIDDRIELIVAFLESSRPAHGTFGKVRRSQEWRLRSPTLRSPPDKTPVPAHPHNGTDTLRSSSLTEASSSKRFWSSHSTGGYCRALHATHTDIRGASARCFLEPVWVGPPARSRRPSRPSEYVAPITSRPGSRLPTGIHRTAGEPPAPQRASCAHSSAPEAQRPLAGGSAGGATAGPPHLKSTRPGGPPERRREMVHAPIVSIDATPSLRRRSPPRRDPGRFL